MSEDGVLQRSLRDFCGAGYDRGRNRLWQAAWFACMNLIFGAWWCPSRLRPILLRAFGASVGERVFIRHRIRVLWPWKLTIGDDCWIGEDVWLLNLEPIIVGHDVCLSQGVYLCTGGHNRRSPSMEYNNGPIAIGDGAWLATQALVLRGVSVGVGATVGARALVTRDVPDGAIVRAADRW
jgi:putative colanic acid biosynthesis acetyltransferase WcaF